MKFKAIFKPCLNNRGFEVREFKMNKGKPKGIRAVNINENYEKELPVLKPKVRCKNKTEYLNQFKQFDFSYDNQLDLFRL